MPTLFTKIINKDDSNATLKTLYFNPFIVFNKNMNDKNQVSDLNLPHMSFLLLTQITYHQKVLRVSLKPKLYRKFFLCFTFKY